MKTRVLLFVFALSIAPLAATQEGFFTWNLLWSGSWYKSVPRAEEGFPAAEDIFSGGTLFNRADFRLGIAQDFSFRLIATDRRDIPFDDNDRRAGFHPGIGMYHRPSGSRFLAGVQSEYGLPARIRNVWLRSVPFMESRSPSSRDLKLEPSARDEREMYLYLALPPDFLPGLGLFASAALDADHNPALGAGFGLELGNAVLRIESFYTQKTLDARSVSTWFSESPPLPERDFRIYSAAIIFNAPRLGFACDWAVSEMFAWGRGTYGNFALRLGNRPWRFSLAGDGASSRFADRNGSTAASAAGAGFRLAARTEYFLPRSGLLRFQSILRAPALDEDFERGSVSVFYRRPAPTAAQRREGAQRIRFSRASVSFNRDARTPERSIDTLNALAGFNFGLLSAAFSAGYTGLSALEANSETSALFQPGFFENFESFRATGELGLNSSPFNIRTRLSYTTRANTDPLWEFSLNCSFRPSRWSRLTLNIAATDFPGKWNYTISWRYGVNQ